MEGRGGREGKEKRSLPLKTREREIRKKRKKAEFLHALVCSPLKCAFHGIPTVSRTRCVRLGPHGHDKGRGKGAARGVWQKPPFRATGAIRFGVEQSDQKKFDSESTAPPRTALVRVCFDIQCSGAESAAAETHQGTRAAACRRARRRQRRGKEQHQRRKRACGRRLRRGARSAWTAWWRPS